MIRLIDLISAARINAHKISSTLNEGTMSDLDLIAQESQNLEDFIRQVSADTDYQDIFQIDNPESMAYLKDIYAASHETDEPHLDNESAQSQAIRLIGNNADLVATNYVAWLEDNLEELEAAGDMTLRQRFDTVLKARFALMDSEADDIVAYIMRQHGASMHPESELLTFIRKFL
tara:strand:- start:714 stop:1238 length:525 start_codon:yes stop_codon:yes gene_type:complete